MIAGLRPGRKLGGFKTNLTKRWLESAVLANVRQDSGPKFNYACMSSRRSLSKRSSASTRCSTSNAASTARARKSVCGCAGNRVHRLWRNWKRGCENSDPVLSRASSVAEPIDCMLRRWDRFARFIDDGRICLTNNAAERALRGFALGRRSWLFAGSERGADRAAVMATLIMTSIRKPGWPMCWPASPSIRSIGSMISCRGSGILTGAPNRQPDLGRHLTRLHHHLRRRNARRG